MKDFAERLADDQLYELSVDLMVQLEKGTGTRPVLWLLCRARKRAAESIAALAKVSATKTTEILTLQSQIQLYDELMQDCHELLARAKEEDALLAEREREELADVLQPEEARALGLNPAAEDS